MLGQRHALWSPADGWLYVEATLKTLYGDIQSNRCGRSFGGAITPNMRRATRIVNAVFCACRALCPGGDTDMGLWREPAAHPLCSLPLGWKGQWQNGDGLLRFCGWWRWRHLLLGHALGRRQPLLQPAWPGRLAAMGGFTPISPTGAAR